MIFKKHLNLPDSFQNKSLLELAQSCVLKEERGNLKYHRESEVVVCDYPAITKNKWLITPLQLTLYDMEFKKVQNSSVLQIRFRLYNLYLYSILIGGVLSLSVGLDIGALAGLASWIFFVWMSYLEVRWRVSVMRYQLDPIN